MVLASAWPSVVEVHGDPVGADSLAAQGLQQGMDAAVCRRRSCRLAEIAAEVHEALGDLDDLVDRDGALHGSPKHIET